MTANGRMVDLKHRLFDRVLVQVTTHWSRSLSKAWRSAGNPDFGALLSLSNRFFDLWHEIHIYKYNRVHPNCNRLHCAR